MFAYVDADDRHHAPCRELLESHPGPLLVPTPFVTEVAYLVSSRLRADAEIKFLGDFALGNLIAEPVLAADWFRIAELVGIYRDLPLGSVDASVITAAERLGIAQIATLDRQHFSVVRPAHIEAFELLPWTSVDPSAHLLGARVACLICSHGLSKMGRRSGRSSVSRASQECLKAQGCSATLGVRHAA